MCYTVYIFLNIGDDFVQCVPTKKGHQILYKGFTYVFKSRLQCGSEQWSCSYRQKTEESIPEWVTIYFAKNTYNEYRCNICESNVHTTENSPEWLKHIKTDHKEIYDLHKENPEATVGFQIQLLNMSEDESLKSQPVIVEEICETADEEVVLSTPETDTAVKCIVNPCGTTEKVKKRRKMSTEEKRKRSWVWKYFFPINSVIHRCSICDSVLSIKGCNTNNMNRHIKSRHPGIYLMETRAGVTKSVKIIEQPDLTEGDDTSIAVKTEIISATDKDVDESMESSAQSSLRARSWIWMYFDRKTSTTAQCRLCRRIICHGGNATGNMNRHLKIIHKKTAGEEDCNWIWKVFERDDDDFYSCKICQYRCMKFEDNDRSVCCILQHLKVDHGVVSGDQIITDNDDGADDKN